MFDYFSKPNTNDLYIHYMDKCTGTLPSLEAKKVPPNFGNKEINVLKNCISTSIQPPYVRHWRLVMSFWLKVFI